MFSNEFAYEYHKRLNGMVENQMRIAITHLSDFWYTAWVNAGKPNLNNLELEKNIDEDILKLKLEKQIWLKGQIPRIKTDNEFEK